MMQDGQKPEDAATLVLIRRRNIRLLAACMSWLLLVLVPVLVISPFVLDASHNAASVGIAWACGAVLLATGLFLRRASGPDWLSLSLDDQGFTIRQGRRESYYDWPSVALVQATRRNNGRTNVATVLVRLGTGAGVYLDDVYTMRPVELAQRMRACCEHAGNPWPSAPMAARKQRTLWLRRLIWPLVGVVMLAMMGVTLWRLHDSVKIPLPVAGAVAGDVSSGH